MIPRRLSSLLVRVAAGIGSTIGAGPRLIGGSGPHEVVENGPRGIRGYATSSSSSLPTPRTSTRRRHLYWGTTSRGKMIYVSVSVVAASRSTIAEDQRRIDGSGLPPLAGKEPMRNALEMRD